MLRYQCRSNMTAVILFGSVCPAHATGQTLLELQAKEQAALKAYESARASRLAREIADDEQAIAAKKAEFARLKQAASATGQQVAKISVEAAAATFEPPTADVSQAKPTTTNKALTANEPENRAKSEKSPPELSAKESKSGNAPAREFGGIKFGIGLAYTLDTGKYQRVREAELVNNIVRVKQSEQSSARIVLESHYFLTPTWKGVNDFMQTLGVGKNEPDKLNSEKIKASWGFGPFVALQPGTDNIIDAIGTGFMIGARRADSGSDSFNLGLGVMVDVNARTLGNGILEDMPLPEGDIIRYKQRSQLGILLLSSYSF